MSDLLDKSVISNFNRNDNIIICYLILFQGCVLYIRSIQNNDFTILS